VCTGTDVSNSNVKDGVKKMLPSLIEDSHDHKLYNMPSTSYSSQLRQHHDRAADSGITYNDEFIKYIIFNVNLYI
jgi:hypothetical protein